MTQPEIPRAVLEALAEAVDAFWDKPGDSAPMHEVRVALNFYRAAKRPLRTKAEVDADLVNAVRKWIADVEDVIAYRKLKILCSEPTRDVPGKCACSSAGPCYGCR